MSPLFVLQPFAFIFGLVLQASPQAYRGEAPVLPNVDGSFFCEAEEFRPLAAAWKALPWGTNYYAATLANTFLSRKAYLSADPQAAGEARITLNVPRAGRYLALVRYDAVVRFETQFTVRIEQPGRPVWTRAYGHREALKIWPFGERLKAEVRWPWGAVENIVWEGHDAVVDLEPGPATLTLVSDSQPEPAARRNLDLVLLTPDLPGVEARLASENYLPLDGLLTQEGDLFVRLHVAADGSDTTVTFAPMREHSPYWVHQRAWQPRSLQAAAGGTSEWLDVGSLLDTLNDGQWPLTATASGPLHYFLEFAATDAAGERHAIRTVESRAATLELAVQADTRYSPRIRTAPEVLHNLLAELRADPDPGLPPTQTLIYALTFDPLPDDPEYMQAREVFMRLFGLVDPAAPVPASGRVQGYLNLGYQTTEQLATRGKELQANGQAGQVAVISLGDEIGLPAPPADADEPFRQWLRGQGLTPADVQPAAGDDWSQVHYQPDLAQRESSPRTFYYSRRFANAWGIGQQKLQTDTLTAYLPQAGIGANFSPHHGQPYRGNATQWINVFRQSGLTMPWGEDYIWQVPVGTQQMNFLMLDLFRSGLKEFPDRKIQYYVMPHTPGNTPSSWRRQFYGDLGHGMKIVNLFEFRPVQAAYTENHTSDPAMYRQVRRTLAELTRFEDIVQSSRVAPGLAGLWYGETGEIWGDDRDPLAAARRTLYITALHAGWPLDVVTEEDATANGLSSRDGELAKVPEGLAGYRVLLLVDSHVSRAASRGLAAWVASGGHLLATAGAGQWDEFHEPNEILGDLLGLRWQQVDEPAEAGCRFEKQDLPWLSPLDQVAWQSPAGLRVLLVFCRRAHLTLTTGQTVGQFTNGDPAVVRQEVGQGLAISCGFEPGLTYFQPALPRRPVDRGATDDAYSHFIPTQFAVAARELLQWASGDLPLPFRCSEPLVQATLLESPQGRAIPLVNWSGGPVKELRVFVAGPAATTASLASGANWAAPPAAAVEGGLAGQVYTLDLDVADAIVLR